MDETQQHECRRSDDPDRKSGNAGPDGHRSPCGEAAPFERSPDAGVDASCTLHVVDDDTVFLIGAKRVLKRIGCTVHTFASTDEALARFADEEPDLIFVDVHMPALDGTEFLDRALGSRRAHPARVFLDSAGPPSREVRDWCEDRGIALVDKREMLDRDRMRDLVEAWRRAETPSGRPCGL